MTNPSTQKSTGQSASGWHRISTFARCPQRFSYRYNLHYVRRMEGPATGLGTAFHELAAAYYSGEDWRDMAEKLRTGAALGGRVMAFAERAADLFERYLKYYDNEVLDVLAVEYEIPVHIDGHAFTRRVDLVYREKETGLICIADHKTASDTSRRLAGARLDWSLSTQELVGRAMLPQVFGGEYGHFVLNLVPTAAARANTFRRQPVAFAPRELEAQAQSLRYMFASLESLCSQGISFWEWPRTGACAGKYGVCAYRQLCESGPAMAPAYAVEVP